MGVRLLVFTGYYQYLIHISVTAEGVVEKPDVVGAIFGQTEGLLGEDLDLRDLQRTGRVGRIDVQITSKKGETKGEILISSSLDRAETAILAASLETIDRVGPCVAHVTVESIEDIRVSKRKKIVERAKEILIERFEDGTIDCDELLDDVRQSLRIEKIGSIGEERSPAGPNVLESDAIIIVEGRADVLNLLRYGIKNAVAVEGTNIPKSVVESVREEDHHRVLRRRPGRRTDPARTPAGSRHRLRCVLPQGKECRGHDEERGDQDPPQQGTRGICAGPVLRGLGRTSRPTCASAVRRPNLKSPRSGKAGTTPRQNARGTRQVAP